MSSYFKLNQVIQDKQAVVIGPSSAFVHKLDECVPKSIEVSHQVNKHIKGSYILKGGVYLTVIFSGYQSEEKRKHYYKKLLDNASLNKDKIN